jgi:hypothetical protein
VSCHFQAKSPRHHSGWTELEPLQNQAYYYEPHGNYQASGREDTLLHRLPKDPAPTSSFTPQRCNILSYCGRTSHLRPPASKHDHTYILTGLHRAELASQGCNSLSYCDITYQPVVIPNKQSRPYIHAHWFALCFFTIAAKREFSFASRLAGESYSATTPPSNTRMRSLSMIVLMRCAIVKIVHPPNDLCKTHICHITTCIEKQIDACMHTYIHANNEWC